MSLIPSFYQGSIPPPNIIERLRSLFGFFLLTAIVGGSIYIFINWQKSSKLLGFSPYKEVAILDLLSYANLYDGKKVCTKGYFVESITYSVIKVSLAEDQFRRSAWINNPEGHVIIANKSYDPQAVIATICGYFESRRDGQFGTPPAWIHQLTVESFKVEGEPFSF